MANETIHQIKIRGTVIDLSSKKDTYFDLDAKATRSWKTGILNRNRIRKNCFKCECTIENRTQAYVESVLRLLDPQSFEVEVYDKYKGQRETKTMYCGDRSVEDYETVNGTTSTLSFSLIEI